jgi:TonB family protein
MVGSRVTAPKKTRNVPPVYPPDMIQARVQGIVLAQSLITTTGCVIDAVVTRRVHPALDVSALSAIGEWRYEPATLNGTVVPVIMTVTVNFSLR